MFQLYQSAVLEGTTNKLTIVQHTVDEERGTNTLKSMWGNIGGSRIILENTDQTLDEAFQTKNVTITHEQRVKSVLLQDILDNMFADKTRRDKPVVIMKLDIETFECRALLGSPDLFSLQQPYYVPFLVMEWYFATKNEEDKYVFPKSCPQTKLLRMRDLLLDKGYEPWGEAGEGKWVRLSAKKALRWYKTNVVWRHKMAPLSVLPKVL